MSRPGGVTRRAGFSLLAANASHGATAPYMNASMKLVRCVAPGELEFADRPAPGSPPEGWALVDVSHVGICGTDYHIFEGKHPFLAYPRVMGHEVSGTVVDDQWTCHRCGRTGRHRQSLSVLRQVRRLPPAASPTAAFRSRCSACIATAR